ncbi:MAG: hypothetical protein OEM27_02410 [Nitrospinota bacterium]|nr:hypothetical protein [Nitrospinota bacterium]
MNAKALVLVLISVCMLMTGKPVHAEEKMKVKLSTGFDYSQGDYGRTIDTEIWYFPLITKATYKNWSAKLTVPYLQIKGPGGVIGGGDVVVVCDDNSGPGKGGGCPDVNTNANANTVTTESGLGDIIGSLTYTLYLEDNDLYLDFTGKIKVPAADEDKGLGTGETDYTVQLDFTKMFGSAYIFGGGGRRFVGENERLQFDDVWLFNAGAGYQISKKFGVGVSYDFRESPSIAEDLSEATAYFTYKVTDSITTMLYGVVGFSDGSPDNSVGLQLNYKFDLF